MLLLTLAQFHTHFGCTGPSVHCLGIEKQQIIYPLFSFTLLLLPFLWFISRQFDMFWGFFWEGEGVVQQKSSCSNCLQHVHCLQHVLMQPCTKLECCNYFDGFYKYLCAEAWNTSPTNNLFLVEFCSLVDCRCWRPAEKKTILQHLNTRRSCSIRHQSTLRRGGHCEFQL